MIVSTLKEIRRSLKQKTIVSAHIQASWSITSLIFVQKLLTPRTQKRKLLCNSSSSFIVLGRPQFLHEYVGSNAAGIARTKAKWAAGNNQW